MRISDWSSDVCSSDLIEFLHALDELVGVDEAFHADPGRDGADEIFHLLGTPVVIDVDHAADREAREIVRGRAGGVELLAADIVDIDVYPRLPDAFERGRDLRQPRPRTVLHRRASAEAT